MTRGNKKIICFVQPNNFEYVTSVACDVFSYFISESSEHIEIVKNNASPFQHFLKLTFFFFVYMNGRRKLRLLTNTAFEILKWQQKLTGKREMIFKTENRQSREEW